MKSLLIVAILSIFFSCKVNETETNNSTTKKEESNKYYAEQIDTTILDDLDGDGELDTAFIYTPMTNLEIDKNGDTLFSPGCKDNNCFNKISFSSKYPAIEIENSVWGQIESIDDLDNDGIKEIVIATNWFTTTRSNLYLFSLKNDKWVEIEKISFRKKDNESLKNQTRKKDGKYYLIGTETSDGDEVQTLKEIKLK